MRITKEDSIVLVVDYQERLMPVMYQAEDMVADSMKLIAGLKALEIPFIATRQYPKGLGDFIPEIKEALGQYTPMDKTAFSVCGDAAIMQAIQAAGKKNVILCGVEAHICLLQSAIDLQAAGYQPVLVCDCVTSRKQSDLNIAIMRAKQEGVLLTTYEALLYEMLAKAGGDAFKAISKIVK